MTSLQNKDSRFVLRADGLVHSSDVRHVSSATRNVLTASRDCSAMIHPMPLPSDTIPPGLVLVGHTEFVNFVLFHPSIALLDNEACIVTGSNDKHVALWNPITASLEAVLDGHAHGVCCGVIVEQNGGDIVTGDWGGICVVFDSTTGNVKQMYNGHKTAVRAVTQLPGTNSIVSASGDKTLHQWDFVTGATITIFEGHLDVVQCVCAMSATRFASGSNDATIIIWDTLAGASPLRILKAHDSLLYGLCYCPMRQLLFSASEDRTVRVWHGGVIDIFSTNSADDVCVLQSINHPCVVWCVCLTAQGDLVTGGADGVLRLWTSDEDAMASVEKLQALQDAVATQKIDVKVSAIAGVDVSALPHINELLHSKGVTQGERRYARDNGLVELYAWDGGCWCKVGMVVEGPHGESYTGASNARPKVYLNGVAYDYVFDVDVNGNMLKLTYNKGQSIFDAAQNFIYENSQLVSQSHKEEIQNFILQNIDPSDMELLGLPRSTTTAPAPPHFTTTNEPLFSEFAREAAALRQSGVSYTPSWREALQSMTAAGVAASEIAFSEYAREAKVIQEQTVKEDNVVSSHSKDENSNTVAVWDEYKQFSPLNITGAKKKITELTGDTKSEELVDQVSSLAKGKPNEAILHDIVALYHQLPESSRFPAIDLLNHLLASATRPFDWLLLLLGGDGGHETTTWMFLKERLQNLGSVPETEALVTMRLFAQAVRALDTQTGAVSLTPQQAEFFRTALSKAPQPFLRTKNNNLKIIISALFRNAAVLLMRGPRLLNTDAVCGIIQGVVELIAQWLVFESISSPLLHEIMSTLLTLFCSSSTAKIAVEVGRSTLMHSIQAMKSYSSLQCQEATAIILRAFDDAESS